MDSLAVKNFWLKVSLSAPAGIFFVHEDLWRLFYSVMGLVIIDTVAGVIVTWNLKLLSSWKFGRVITKGTVYMMAFCAMYFLTIANPSNALVIKPFATILAVNEIWSIFEKLALLGFKTPLWALSKINDQFRQLHIAQAPSDKEAIAKEILKKK